MTYEHYNRKDKLERVEKHEIRSVEKDGEGMKAEVYTESADKKGKDQMSGSFVVTCDGNRLMIDVSGMMPQEAMASLGNTGEVEMEGDGFIIPNDLVVGKKLPDSENVVKISTGPMNMEMKMNITDHIVESKETIDTPAGSFECYKIVYNMNTKMMMVNNTMKIASWYADGIGVVRTETYKENGKLMATQLLTAYSK